MTKANPKVVHGQETVQKMVQVARDLFSRYGYANTPTEEIVHQAGVTRGALYHHFKGKQDLFLAVFEEAQQEISARIVEAAEAAGTPWEALTAGCQGFLAACMDPQLQQIVIIDAPAVLGWEMWRQIDSKHGLNDLKQALRDLSEAGLIKPLPLEALAHLLSGAMNEAVLWIAQAERPDQALGEATEALNTLLAALRE